MRILHGPVNVGNQPWTLSRAERALGHVSDVVVNYGTWLGYPADVTLSNYANKTHVTRLRRAAFAMLYPFRYDVIHYYFGRNFLLWDDFGRSLGRGTRRDDRTLRDVRLAKQLGKILVMTLQGCDARQADVSNRSNNITMCRAGACPAYVACMGGVDAARRTMIKTLLPLMDRVFYLNPELGHILPGGTFLPYANVDIAAQSIVLPRRGVRPRVVHAPSSSGIKGTPLILASLERLKVRYDFELILIENKPHAEAMELYRSADLAIDQVLAGWYGGFAVELMAMGKPVVAYIRDEDKAFVPLDMWNELPILRVNPLTLDEDLALILAAPDQLRDVGVKARRFVERWHDPNNIARSMLKIYSDPTVPLRLEGDKEHQV